MKMTDWITVLAIIAGPILAVQAQKWVERVREKKNQRLWVFKRLMTTRGATVSLGHVEALNAIDLEFAGRSKKDEQVRRRWREYLDQPGSLSQDPEQQQRQLAGARPDESRQRLARAALESQSDLSVNTSAGRNGIAIAPWQSALMLAGEKMIALYRYLEENLSMPKIFEKEGYRFFFYSNEHRPIMFMSDTVVEKQSSRLNHSSSCVNLSG